MQAITINYGTEIDKNTLKPVKIITVTVDEEGLQNLKMITGSEGVEKAISEIQEEIKQIIKGE